MMKQIELLAPAKNLEIGIAAINCGADAVYIGCEKFGARQAAANTTDDIKKLVVYAHKYDVKVYVTINTILFDSELNDCLNLINQLYEIGVDAIIIQDMGILELNLPPIQIHASTQMHNTTVEQVKFLQDVGISRVVLARELNIEQIKTIKSQTNVELEAFIHGSLCVSYSGRCFMSKHISDRSGNRGECTQPCRSYYNLLNAQGEPFIKHKHLLSLKDLNLTSHIAEMIDAGITSFKIEGRLKDIIYVKNIVAHYRQAIDLILQSRPDHAKSSSGDIALQFTPDPQRTFNRQYTNYFIADRHADNNSPYTQKSFGKPIGKVTYIDRDMIEIENGSEINTGDGVCYLDNYNTMQGFNVSRKIGNMIAVPKDKAIPNKNSIIYRNYDSAFEKIVSSEKSASRKIEVTIDLRETPTGLAIRATDTDNNTATETIETDKVIATNPQLASTSLISLLSKSGDTIFKIKDVNIHLNNAYIFKSSIINTLRRSVLDKLGTTRIGNYERQKATFVNRDIPYHKEELTRYDNITNNLAHQFYKHHGVKTIEIGVDNGETPVFLMTTKHCIKYELGLCAKNKNHTPTLTFDNSKAIEPFTLQDSTNSYLLTFDCNKCVMNVLKK